MTVSELIEKLSSFPKNAKIAQYSDHTGGHYAIGEPEIKRLIAIDDEENDEIAEYPQHDSEGDEWVVFPAIV